MKISKPEDVDSYIANSSMEAQLILKEIREIIKSAVPKVEEKISWGVPFYRYNGDLGGFAVYKNHVSFGFGAEALQSEVRKMLEEKGYTVLKGTIQIKFGQKVPASAIKQILKVKVKMNEDKRAPE